MIFNVFLIGFLMVVEWFLIVFFPHAFARFIEQQQKVEEMGQRSSKT